MTIYARIVAGSELAESTFAEVHRSAEAARHSDDHIDAELFQSGVADAVYRDEITRLVDFLPDASAGVIDSFAVLSETAGTLAIVSCCMLAMYTSGGVVTSVGGAGGVGHISFPRKVLHYAYSS